MKKFLSFLIKAFNFLLIGGSFALFFVAIFRPDLVEKFIEWMGMVIESLGNWNYLIAFSSSMIEAFPLIGVVVPGQNIMFLVGGFFGQNNLSGVILVAILGAILGNWIGYLLGMYFGESFFEKYGNWIGIGTTEVAYLKKGIHKYGAWAVIFSKFHPMTRAFIPFIAGSMGMRQPAFIAYNVLGSIIWAITIILLGVVFVDYYKVILQYFPYIFGALFFGGMAYVYFFKKEALKKYMILKEKEMYARYKK